MACAAFSAAGPGPPQRRTRPRDGLGGSCYRRLVVFCVGLVKRGRACPRVAGRVALAGLVVVATGCAPSLATMQPAHVAPAGRLQATAGVEANIPTGTIDRLVDSAASLAAQARNRSLTDAEVAELFDAGINLAVSPPSVGYLFALAYTIVDRTEVQVRYAGGGWRLGGRYQLLRHEDGPFDLVVGLGVARSTASVPLADELPFVAIDDFSRWTFDVPALIGTSRNWFRVWVGPRLLYSRFGTRVTVTLPNNPAEAVRLDGQALYLGGQGGIALGYRYAFLALELTMGQLRGSAVSSSMTTAGARDTEVRGFVIYPAFAMMGEF